MPRKPEPLEPWMLEAIELIVRRQLTLHQAAQQLGVEITTKQADNILGRVRFQNELEEARLRHYAEIGSHPRLTRDAVVGQLFVLAQRLTADREDAKAADALLKLAKVQNWTSGEDYKDRPVFGNLTQADIDRLRAEYKAKEDQQRTTGEQTVESSGQPSAKSKVN